MYLPEITLAIFSILSILRLGSYLPQIVCAANDTEGATTWCVRIGANGSTAAYAASTLQIGRSSPSAPSMPLAALPSSR